MNTSRRAAGCRLGNAIDACREEIEQTKPPGKNEQTTLARLKTQLGATPLAQLRSSKITQFVRDRIAEGTGGLTVSADLIQLGTVLKWCREVERLDVSVEVLGDGRRAMQRPGPSTRSKERDRHRDAAWRDPPDRMARPRRDQSHGSHSR